MTRRYRQVIRLGLALLLVLLSGCALAAAPRSSTRGGATPTSHVPAASVVRLTPGLMDDKPAPTGWTRLLNGQRFTDATTVGLVASAARPGRLAGCALPAGTHIAIPVFVLSDDAGATWQAHAITGIEATPACMVVADAEQPNMFVVWASPALVYTTDAGATWRPVPAPVGATAQLTGPIVADTTMVLVNGVLLAQLAPGYRLAELTLGRSSTWRPVDTTLFALVNKTEPAVILAGNTVEAFALDPQNPARIYAAMPLGAKGDDIFRSDDSGATWKTMLTLPTTERVQLWTAQQHRVFVEDLFDQRPVPYLFYASQDDGATWTGSLLHGERASGEFVYVSPAGVVLTYFETTAGDAYVGALYRLDTATGAFTTLATNAALATEGGGLGVVVDGAHPSFISITASDTYAFPL